MRVYVLAGQYTTQDNLLCHLRSTGRRRREKNGQVSKDTLFLGPQKIF